MALASTSASPSFTPGGISVDPTAFANLIYEHNSKPLGGDPFFIIDAKSGEVIVNFIGFKPVLPSHGETEKARIIEENIANAERQFYADMIRDGFTIIGLDSKEYKPDDRFRLKGCNAKDPKIQDDFKKNISIKMLTALRSSSEQIIFAISHFYSQALHNAIPGFYCTTKIGRRDAAFVPAIPSGGSWSSLRKKDTQFLLQFEYRYNSFSIDIPGTTGANCPAHLGLKVTLEFSVAAAPKSAPAPCKLATVELFGTDAPIFDALIKRLITHAEIIDALIKRKAFREEVNPSHKHTDSAKTLTYPASPASEASTARSGAASLSSMTRTGAGSDSASSLITLVTEEIKPSAQEQILSELPLGLFSSKLVLAATPIFFQLMQDKKLPPEEGMLLCSTFFKRLATSDRTSFLAYVWAQQEISVQVLKLAHPELPTTTSDSTVETKEVVDTKADPLIEAASFWSVIRTACSSALDELGLVKR